MSNASKNSIPKPLHFGIVTVPRFIIGCMILVGILINVANVIGRYMFLEPIIWAEEIMIYIMVWTVFIGAILVSYDGQHLKMDVFSVMLPSPYKEIINFIATASVLLVCIYVIPNNWIVVELMWNNDQRSVVAEVPMLATWDDHEVMNNWWPGRRMTWKQQHRKGYRVKETEILEKNGRQAFFEYTPMRRNGVDPDRIYRVVPCGPLADVFMLDGRSYRSPNDRNRETAPGKDTAMLGTEQITWLKNALKQSKAVWKIIANPQPLAHVEKQPSPRYDQWANGDHGKPLGREQEAADILSFIKRENIRNTVWLAADVHYSAAYRFDPNQAAFQDFNPFWEFISGPFHTRPGRVKHFDKTFGANQQYRTPVAPIINPPPSDGFLYFGHANINAKTGAMRVTLRDLNDRTLFSVTLEAAG